MKLIAVVAMTLFCGCTAVRDFVYDPVVSVDPRTGIVSTNSWTIKPGFKKGVELAGDVAPVPWAGLASQLIMGALGVGGALYGRKYRQAGRSMVETIDVYRQGVRNLEGGKDFDDRAINDMAAKHTNDRVIRTVSGLVKTFTGKTKI